MSLFQRAHDILAAKTNKALDAAEKLYELLDLSYEQMLDQIDQRPAGARAQDSRCAHRSTEEQEPGRPSTILQDQAKARWRRGQGRPGQEALTQARCSGPDRWPWNRSISNLSEEELEQMLYSRCSKG